jgi:hypothetical protein
MPDDLDPPVPPVDLLVPVPPGDGGHEEWQVAASVYLPAREALAGRPPAMVLMPGGGYGRRYFDLPAPGYSQAAYHARRGMVVIAVDHLGVGDSTVPAVEFTTLPAVAAAGHATIGAIIARLAAGTLAPGVPPVQLACVVGAGQSLGGHALAVMQAAHRTFDGVAMLGSSMAGTALPVRPGTPPPVVPDGTTPEQAAQLTRAATDWTWAFHWQDAPLPDELAALIAADIAGGVPARRTTPSWGSLTYPGFGAVSMLPGVVAAEAARIDVPVLLATGERDVCRSPGEEVAVFKAATDISFFRVPRMAHMHNFSATRIVLWDRLGEFTAHVARIGASSGSGCLRSPMPAMHGRPSMPYFVMPASGRGSFLAAPGGLARREAGRSGGRPLDDVPLVRGGRARIAACQAGDDQLGPPSAGVAQVEADRSERRGRQAAGRDVVDSDDGQVTGRGEAVLAHAREHRERGLVVEGADARHRPGRPLLHGGGRGGDLQAGGEHHRRLDAGQRARFRRAFKPVFRHLGEPLMRGQRVADPPVPAADQVLGLNAPDRLRGVSVGRPGREHDVRAGPVERLLGVVVEGGEPDHHRGVDRRADVGQGPAVRASQMGNQGQALVGEGGGQLLDEAADGAAHGQVGDGQEDDIAVPGGQGAGGRVRPVVKLARDLEDAEPGRLRYRVPGLVVEYEAHGGLGDASRPRDVGARDAFRGSRHGLLSR